MLHFLISAEMASNIGVHFGDALNVCDAVEASKANYFTAENLCYT